jgi:hypothetical protein
MPVASGSFFKDKMLQESSFFLGYLSYFHAVLKKILNIIRSGRVKSKVFPGRTASIFPVDTLSGY